MKKRVSILFAIVMAMCILMMPMLSVSALEPATIVASNAVGEVGETVDVTITMTGNPGFVSANLNVNYDAEILTLKDVKDGGLLTGVTHSDNYTTSPYGLCWVNDTAPENFTVNGVLATLTFEISEGAVPGITTVSLEQDILNFDMDNVVFDLVSSEIEIKGKHVHKTELVPASDSNCTEHGNNAYYHCADCGKYFKESEALNETTLADEQLPLLAHKGGVATCTQKAICEMCGKEYGNCTEHKKSDWVVDKEATKTEKGSKHIECTVCGTTLATEEISALTQESTEPTEVPTKATEPSTKNQNTNNNQANNNQVNNSQSNSNGKTVATGENNIIVALVVIMASCLVSIYVFCCLKKSRKTK